MAEEAGYTMLNASKLMTIVADHDEGRGRVSGDLLQFLSHIIYDGAKKIIQIAGESKNWSPGARQK